MRILYLTFDSMSTHGAWSVHVGEIVRRLAGRGHEVAVAGVHPDAVGATAAIPLPRPDSRLGRAFFHFAGSLAPFVRAGSRLRADVVYCRGVHLSLTPLLAARLIGRPFVVEVNGLLEMECPVWLRGPVRAVHRGVLASADAVVTVSDRLRRGMARRYGADPRRIHVVPNGADPGRFPLREAAEARRLAGLEERPTVIYVGSFYPHHALDLIAGVPDLVPEAQFLFVGDGPSRAALEASLAGKRARFYGSLPHERIPDLISAADVGRAAGRLAPGRAVIAVHLPLDR